MERQVIYRDRQEVQAADLNNIQFFADEQSQHVIMDAITQERMFVGLVVTTPSATEIEVSAGRLWNGTAGKLYRKDQPETVSIFSQVPVSDEKWLAVACFGQETEHDIQPRDYEINLETGQTEPRAVPMERLRQVVLHITPGLESPAPQKPEVPTGYLLIAHVRLNSSGVQEIQMAENKKLMRLFDVWQGMLANGAQLTKIMPMIATINTDLANLRKIIASLGEAGLTEVAADLALVKDRLQLPDDFASYGADDFLSPDESDTEDAEYYCRVEEGARPPYAGLREQQPALGNPETNKVKNRAGLILPAYEEVVRLAVTGYSGEISISQYPYFEHVMKQGTRTRTRIRYGPERYVCTNGSGWIAGIENAVSNVFEGPASGWYSPDGAVQQNGTHHWTRVQQYWKDTWLVHYTHWEVQEYTVPGSQIAQTFMAPSSGWITGLNLYLTDIDQTGDIHLHLMEVVPEVGSPDKTRCLGRATVAAGDLKLYSDLQNTPTYFQFEQPVYVEAGQRYGFAVTTTGNHKAAKVQGTELSSGTLFYSTDGAYFQGDFTDDLMFDLLYAEFAQARTEVDLTTISLVDGVADLDLLIEAVIPEATGLAFEYRIDGEAEWHVIAPGTGDSLLGRPAMLHMRAVYLGSRECQAGFYLPGSKFRAARGADNFTHISTERTLSGASEDIIVMLDLEHWDYGRHGCDCVLIDGANTYNPDSSSDQARTLTFNGQEISGIRRTFNFLPEPGTGISTYQIKITGSTTTALQPFHVARRMDVAK